MGWAAEGRGGGREGGREGEIGYEGNAWISVCEERREGGKEGRQR